MNDTCKVQVSDGARSMRFHTCGKKLSGSDDYPEYCGMHAAAKRRQSAKDDHRITRTAEIEAAMKATRDRTDRVAATLGVELTVETRFPTTGPDAFLPSQPTGKVIVDIAQLEALVKDVERLRSALAEAAEAFLP
jgi:hypothetical protein